MATSTRETETAAKSPTARLPHDRPAPEAVEVAPPAVTAPQAALLRLQRSHGNRYVQRLVALARRAEGERGGEIAPEVEAAIESERGGGQALGDAARAEMEPFFADDFRNVRIHVGAHADMLNRALSARAFTTGSDIFFGAGEYAPESAAGRGLLAHELTHVVQQAAGTGDHHAASTQLAALESEAERMADVVERSAAVESQREPSAPPAAAVSRQGIQRAAAAPSLATSVQPTKSRAARKTAVWRTEIWDEGWLREKLAVIKILWDYADDGAGNIKIYHATWFFEEPPSQWVSVGVDISSLVIPGIGDEHDQSELWFVVHIGGPKTTYSNTLGISVGAVAELSGPVGSTGAAGKAGLSAGVSWASTRAQTSEGSRGSISRKYLLTAGGPVEKSLYHTDLRDLVIDDDEGPQQNQWWQNDWHLYNRKTTLSFE